MVNTQLSFKWTGPTECCSGKVHQIELYIKDKNIYPLLKPLVKKGNEAWLRFEANDRVYGAISVNDSQISKMCLSVFVEKSYGKISSFTWYPIHLKVPQQIVSDGVYFIHLSSKLEDEGFSFTASLQLNSDFYDLYNKLQPLVNVMFNINSFKDEDKDQLSEFYGMKAIRDILLRVNPGIITQSLKNLKETTYLKALPHEVLEQVMLSYISLLI
jgi:hypothetical protein